MRRNGLMAAGWADSKISVASEQAAVERETARMRARMAAGSSRERVGEALAPGKMCRGST
jgi:hypothetical protein